MGCGSTRMRIRDDVYYAFQPDLQYPQELVITLSKRKQQSVRLSIPIKQKCQSMQMNNCSYDISECILQGCNFFQSLQKQNQDRNFTICKQDWIASVLLDGHGPQGDKVAQSIASFLMQILNEIEVNIISYVTNNLQRELDRHIENLKIDVCNNGSTLVIVIITCDQIFSYNVGDSRAILCVNQEVIQLTQDHSPESKLEQARLQKSSGVVYRLTKGDPLRIYHKNDKGPGLSVSRTIGDLGAKTIGVISEPFINILEHPDQPFVIIIASDGIWSVLDNEYVMFFVENYIDQCPKSDNSYKQVVKPQNSSISRLLAEEARRTYFKYIKTQRVSIDDISCTVIKSSI